jgi:arylsulfatase A-like enzyme
MDVHAPYDAPESDYEALRTSENLQVSHRLDEQERRAVPGYMRRQPWLQRPDSVELKSWRGRYAAGVRAFDRRLSVFLEQLRSAGVLDDSLVVVTSDHGEELLEHGGWDHGHSLYEHQTRIPLMLRFPEAVGGGARIESMANLIDLMPTLLSVGGIDPPQGLHGRDLLPLVEGELPERQVSFANGVQWKPGIHSLRTPRYKLIADLEQGVVQLFDLDEEPLERNDVAATHPQVAEDLGRQLRDYLIDVAASPALRPESVELDEEFKRRLEALGYF